MGRLGTGLQTEDRALHSINGWKLLRTTICVLIVVYMILPLFIVIPISFSSAQFLQFPPPGWSLQWYDNFFSNPVWLKALKTSIKVAVPTTILGTTLGTTAAIGITRGRFPGSGLLNGLLMAPMIVPVIITAAGVFAFYRKLGLHGTVRGLILAHVALTIPYVVVTVSAALRTVDRRLEQAALNLGATPWTAFRRVTLPLIAPGVASGALFALITSFDELVVSLFISTASVRPVTVQMWSDVRGSVDPTIAAVSSLLLVVSLVVMVAVSLLRRSAR